METILGFILASFLSILGIQPSTASVPETRLSNITPTYTTQENKQWKTADFQQKKYRYADIRSTANNVQLISNLPNKKTSLDVKKANNCTSLINGGFYTEKDAHIGLFMTDTIILQEQQPNATFNGLLWATKNGTSGIGIDLPEEPVSFALQTGPVLIDEGTPRTLRLSSDEQARRMIAGITREKKLIFLTIVAEENSFVGPYLQDLPELLSLIDKKEQYSLEQAINLDGGSHSAFITEKVSLLELAPIGSAFCIE